MDPYASHDDPRHWSDDEAPPTQDWWKDEPALEVVDSGVEDEPDGESVPATLAYTLDSVPEKATGDDGVIAWINAAEDEDDAKARAVAALEVERERESMRSTVVAAVEKVTGLIGDAG